MEDAKKNLQTAQDELAVLRFIIELNEKRILPAIEIAKAMDYYSQTRNTKTK